MMCHTQRHYLTPTCVTWEMRVLTAQFSRHHHGDLKQILSHPVVLLHARCHRLFGDVRHSTPVLAACDVYISHTPSKKISGNDVSKGDGVVAVVFLSVLTAGFVTGIKRPQTIGQRHVNISDDSPPPPLPRNYVTGWVFRLNS